MLICKDISPSRPGDSSLVASRNQKKLAELRRVLDGAGLSGLTLVSLNDVAPFDEAPETGATLRKTR